MSALARKVAWRKGITASALTLITEIKNCLRDVMGNDKVKLMGLHNNLNDIVNNLKEIDEEISYRTASCYDITCLKTIG